jgi:16S rRNA G527 N7-methylase RsmG
VESRERRSAFLKHCKAVLGLSNLTVLREHTSKFGLEHALHYDLITARAFAQVDSYLRTALPLLKPGGEIRGYLGAGQSLEPRLLQSLGLSLREQQEYEVEGARRVIYAVLRLPGAPAEV